MMLILIADAYDINPTATPTFPAGTKLVTLAVDEQPSNSSGLKIPGVFENARVKGRVKIELNFIATKAGKNRLTKI